jgi:hypothetical protein
MQPLQYHLRRPAAKHHTTNYARSCGTKEPPMQPPECKLQPIDPVEHHTHTLELLDPEHVRSHSAAMGMPEFHFSL